MQETLPIFYFYCINFIIIIFFIFYEIPKTGHLCLLFYLFPSLVTYISFCRFGGNTMQQFILFSVTLEEKTYKC